MLMCFLFDSYPSSSPSSRILLLLFSHPVTSLSLWPRGPQHARLSCPSPTPGDCSNLCPLSRWCHPTIPSNHPILCCLIPAPQSRYGVFNLFVSLLLSAVPASIKSECNWFNSFSFSPMLHVSFLENEVRKQEWCLNHSKSAETGSSSVLQSGSLHNCSVQLCTFSPNGYFV